MLLSDKSIGIVKIALVKEFYSDDYGLRATSAYTKYKKTLDSKYQDKTSADKCYGSTFMCRIDNYAYSLYKDERFKYNFYSNNTDMIGLKLNGVGVYDIKLEIIYETKEFRDIVANYDKEQNSLLKR